METLKLKDHGLTDEEIAINRARVQGGHDAIKLVIRKIEKQESRNHCEDRENSFDLMRLKEELGMLVYKNWPNKD